MLRLSRDAHLAMIAHALDGLPEEACGLIAGPPPARDGEQPVGPAGASATGGVPVEREQDAPVFFGCRNTAASARVYTVDPRDHLRADREAEDRGLEIVGVVHSHTHTDAYPSPTDVAQAPDPSWHYVIVSLKYDTPVVRSYRILGEEILEEPVVVDPG